MVLLLVLDVSQGLEVKGVAVVRAQVLKQTLGYLCVGLVLKMQQQFVGLVK